jgi:hypothetical protein
MIADPAQSPTSRLLVMWGASFRELRFSGSGRPTGIHEITIPLGRTMMESVFFVLLLGLLPMTFQVKSSAPKTGAIVNRCIAKAFTPNYAVEAGVFQSVRWERFPITIWIDSSTVEDTEEMSELRAGLSEWSDATRGVLGVKFVDDAKDAQIW